MSEPAVVSAAPDRRGLSDDPTAGLRAMLDAAARAHGYEGAVYMHLGHGAANGEGGAARPQRLVAIGRFDAAQYLHRGYLAFDPLAARATASYAPFAWGLDAFDARDSGQGRLRGVLAAWGAERGVVAPVQDYARGPGLLNLFTAGGQEPGTADYGALVTTAAAIHAAAGAMPDGRCRPGPERLNVREMAVLRLAAIGHTEQETAQQLALSRRGVQFHLARAIEKLEAPNKTAAVAAAVSAGLIRL